MRALLVLCLLFVATKGWPTNKWANEEHINSAGKVDANHNVLNQTRGAPVLKGELPYHVTILLDDGRVCSGSIISPSSILTAAQCIINSKHWILHIGMSLDLQIMVSRQADIHLGAQIAVIHTPVPIMFSDSIKAVQLPSVSEDTTDLAGQSVIVSGLGTHDGMARTKLELRVSDVQVLKHEVCAAVSKYHDVICLITPRNQQPCNGDAGTPVIMYNKDGTQTQVAVVIKGHLNCDLGYPEIAIPLRPYVDWIIQIGGLF